MVIAGVNIPGFVDSLQIMQLYFTTGVSVLVLFYAVLCYDLFKCNVHASYDERNV
jgi:hypothetical protein